MITPGAAAVRPRAVIYLYTQTGQLREVAEALTAPMQERGWGIRWVEVQPRENFPFPWPVGKFFGVFARAADPNARADLVEPAGGFHSEPDELVILASQVWYLAPSLPIRSLVAGYPHVVRDRDVVSLIACRNMWYSAGIAMSQLLRKAGARRVSVVAATDTRRSATTLVTTLRWLLTGKREAFLCFDRAGVGEDELSRVAEIGRLLAESRPCPREGAAPVVPALAVADLLASSAFRRWVRLVGFGRRSGPAAHAAVLGAFVLSLTVAIVAGLPLVAVATLVGGAPVASLTRRYLYRRISFGQFVPGTSAIGSDTAASRTVSPEVGIR